MEYVSCRLCKTKIGKGAVRCPVCGKLNIVTVLKPLLIVTLVASGFVVIAMKLI